MNMQRRRFCKIALLATGAVGLTGLRISAENTPVQKTTSSRKYRVTVMRRECYEDLQSLYLDDPETGRCEAFATGETFDIATGSKCPAGFCPMAFDSIIRCVTGPAGCSPVASGACTAITTCPDGSRPVIFKIEAL